MKKILVTFILFFSLLYGHAQNNIAKLNVSLGLAGAQYERSLLDHFSVLGQVGYGFINVSDGYNSDIATGIGYSAAGRFYFSSEKGRMQGWHIGPKVHYLNTKVKSSHFDNQKLQLNVYSLNTGKQWVYKSNLTFEFELGLGYQDFAENDFNDSNSTQLAILVVFL